MIIEANKVVAFHYIICSQDGIELESSKGGDPSIYLQGARNIFPQLERAMAGKQPGDRLEVALDKYAAYGPRQEALVKQVAIKHIVSTERKLRVGCRAVLANTADRDPVTIIKVGKYQATVDGNHPLAGRDLVFEIEIDSVRDATPDELAHGHAHGIDGTAGH